MSRKVPRVRIPASPLFYNSLPNARARQACVRCLKELGCYAGIKVDWTGLAGNYRPEAFDPNGLPTDEVIEQTWEQIASPRVRWM